MSLKIINLALSKSPIATLKGEYAKINEFYASHNSTVLDESKAQKSIIARLINEEYFANKLTDGSTNYNFMKKDLSDYVESHPEFTMESPIDEDIREICETFITSPEISTDELEVNCFLVSKIQLVPEYLQQTFDLMA